MSLPANFTSCPQEDLHHHCRTISAELRKNLKTTKDISELQMAFERYLNIVKHLDWHRKTTSVYHKDEGDKAANKLVKEFNRYLEALETNHEQAVPQSLLHALAEIEQLIQSL